MFLMGEVQGSVRAQERVAAFMVKMQVPTITQNRCYLPLILAVVALQIKDAQMGILGLMQVRYTII
jgi:hypothetical protein